VNIPIAYEDNWLLVADKPSGLLVMPTPKREKRTLNDILNKDLEERKITYRLHPCHRLDRETSGLIIYAKGKSVQKKMMDVFKERKVKKTYIAFVQGAMPAERGQIQLPLEGLSALTSYRVLEKRKDFSVLEVTPLTGRTNQIRIHLKYMAHPVVGETKYAFRKDFLLRAKRLCLHAQKLEFIHPKTGKLLKLTADLPNGLKGFLDKHL